MKNFLSMPQQNPGAVACVSSDWVINVAGYGRAQSLEG